MDASEPYNESLQVLHWKKKIKILHLEDTPSDVKLIWKILDKINPDFEKVIADTKEGFVKALKEFSPDIILSDHKLISFNSHEALQLLYDLGYRIPFILVTSTMSDEFAADVIKRGADDYVLKDRLNRLPVAIYNVLEKYKLEKEKKIILEELLKNEKRYRAIIENSSDGIIIFSRGGECLYASSAVKKISGYSEKEIKETSLSAFVHPDDAAALLLTIKNALANPGVAMKAQIWRLRHKDGSWRWLESIITNMLHDTSINGLIDNFRDVTENELAEQALRAKAKELTASNEELERFAYVASHDLQEPLRMVTSFLSQIEKKYESLLDDKGKQYIHFAVDGAKRMRQIILDLLEFSKIGRTEDKLQEINFNELVEETLSLLRKKIEESKAIIKIGKLPTLKTFKSPVRQVFQNLINNALIYHKNEGAHQIDISAKEDNDVWQFVIADNGIGINSEYFEKIFTIFQRLHNKDEFSGTGIGLAITKKIIENMGGKIWVESEEGKGSIFYFTITKQNTA